MDLPEFRMKNLLQEEIELITEKEFSFAVECCVRGYIFQSFWEAPIGSVLIAKHEEFAISLVNYLIRRQYFYFLHVFLGITG